MRRDRYSIDLAAQQAECEANYARLMRLLPNIDVVDCCDLGIGRVHNQRRQYRLSVTERCRYTTMLSISQLDNEHTPWSKTPDFSLRIYHDARMAEVVSVNRHRNLRASYDYPNQQMYQRDEKTQLNQFLGEWLSHCLEHGHTLDDPLEKICS